MHKIGPHIIGGTSVGLGRPAVAKLVNPSLAYTMQVRAQVGPDCLIIVRWMGDQPLDNPLQRAQEWFEAHRTAMFTLKDANVAYEGYNEVHEHAAYATFETERLRLMHQLGLRAVVGNFSVGTPDLPEWAIYQGMLHAMGPRDLLGLHEYWADTDDIDNRYHCARWTLVPALKYVPIVITECGRDIVENKGQPGWKRTCNGDTFLSELGRYDYFLCQYDNVLGATVFTLGNDPKWEMFDPSEIWGRVVAETTPLPEPVSKPPAPPVPEPAPKLVIDGRCMTPTEFAAYVEATDLGVYTDVVMHHTAIPTEESWQGAKTIKAMRRHYERVRGWDKGPHIFAAADGIWLFWDLSKDGYGVYGRNYRVRHIEVVGDYTDHLPSGAILDNAVAAAAILLRKRKLGTGRLRMHREWQDTDCPGDAFAAKFHDWFAPLVQAFAAQPQEDGMFEDALRRAAWLAAKIVYNPLHALPRYAREHNLGMPLTDEFDFEHQGKQYRGQAFAKGIVYAIVGDWGNVTHTEL